MKGGDIDSCRFYILPTLQFVLGPLGWAPASEVWGRRYLFILTYILFTIFNAGVIASQNIWTLVILRFFAGTAGSSPLTNAGYVDDCETGAGDGKLTCEAPMLQWHRCGCIRCFTEGSWHGHLCSSAFHGASSGTHSKLEGPIFCSFLPDANPGTLSRSVDS